MPKARSNDEEIPFEAALTRLEEVVDRLEQGDLELEQSLKAFEEGVTLSKRCASQLDDAEKRIEVLVREGGKWIARPFANDPDETAEPDAEDGDFEEVD